MLKTVMVFGCIYLTLVLARNLFLEMYKKRITCKADGNQSVYRWNQTIIHTEMIYLFVVLMNTIIFCVLKERWAIDAEYRWCSAMFLLLISLTTISPLLFSYPMLWRHKSYFRLDERYLEYNISLENRAKDTIKIFKDEIESVSVNKDKIIIKLKDKKEYVIPEKWLALFNGSGIVKSKLLSYIRKED